MEHPEKCKPLQRIIFVQQLTVITILGFCDWFWADCSFGYAGYDETKPVFLGSSVSSRVRTVRNLNLRQSWPHNAWPPNLNFKTQNRRWKWKYFLLKTILARSWPLQPRPVSLAVLLQKKKKLYVPIVALKWEWMECNLEPWTKTSVSIQNLALFRQEDSCTSVIQVLVIDSIWWIGWGSNHYFIGWVSLVPNEVLLR